MGILKPQTGDTKARLERKRQPAGHLRLSGRHHRRAGADRTALLAGKHHRGCGGHAPLHPAGTGRARCLCPRGLLCLPQPDDPPDARRGRTLWPLFSLAAESKYDHPFQWGSKRTGPDLARVGGRYSDEWHVDHLRDPQSVVPESVMPKYGFLENRLIDGKYIEDRLRTDRLVGVPYTDEMVENAAADFRAQSNPDADYGRAAGTLRRHRADPQFRRRCGYLRGRCADRLSSDAGHAGRFLDLHPRGKPVREGKTWKPIHSCANWPIAGCFCSCSCSSQAWCSGCSGPDRPNLR